MAEEKTERPIGGPANECWSFLLGVASHLTFGLVIVDTKAGLLLVNEAGTRLGAVDEAANAAAKLLDPEGNELPAEQQPLVRAIEEQRVESIQGLLPKKGGGHRLVSVSARPVTRSDGSLIGAIAFYQDAAGAREADRLREEWRSVVAHDLRGPVVTIDLATRLLLDDPVIESSSEARGLLERMAGAAWRMDEMIQNLTDAAQVEAGAVRLEREPLHLDDLIEEAIDSARVPEDRKINLSIGDELPTISGEPERIERILHNLLRNAVVHGGPGTPIGLSVEQLDGQVVTTVRSEGPPVAPADAPRVFERFFKKRMAGSAVATDGLGLGLFVTRGLVQAHGGSVWLESEPDGRTVFRVALPTTE